MAETITETIVRCYCGQVAEKRCVRCKSKNYCSPECQRKDWPLHRLECVPFEEKLREKAKELSAAYEEGFHSSLQFLSRQPEAKETETEAKTEVGGGEKDKWFDELTTLLRDKGRTDALKGLLVTKPEDRFPMYMRRLITSRMAAEKEAIADFDRSPDQTRLFRIDVTGVEEFQAASPPVDRIGVLLAKDSDPGRSLYALYSDRPDEVYWPKRFKVSRSFLVVRGKAGHGGVRARAPPSVVDLIWTGGAETEKEVR